MYGAPLPDKLHNLMAKAGFDGIEWTVRPKGHVLPENAKTDLPKAIEAARKQGLKSTMIVTGVTDGTDPAAETLLKVAADCGVRQYRPGYFFYDVKKETFKQSFDRIKSGFAALAALSEKTGVKTVYQNHSSWGPSVFGGLVWDIWEAIRDLDPKWMGLEYDPMHAYFETNLSWSHGLELVSDRIGAVCLKDFHYQLSKKNPKDHAKFMCAAGEGIVPWKEVKRLLDACAVKAPFTVHFEYKFDETDLVKTVKRELDFFKGVFG
jgi:sugar phosphate isomerase/epimerase